MRQKHYDSKFDERGNYTFILTSAWSFPPKRHLIVLTQDPKSLETVLRSRVKVFEAEHPMPEEAEWREDASGQPGWSYSYCAPLNEKELRRAHEQWRKWKQYLEEDSVTSTTGPYAKDIEFFAQVVEEFKRWYRSHDLTLPSLPPGYSSRKEGSSPPSEVETFRKTPSLRRRQALEGLLVSKGQTVSTYDHDGGLGELARKVVEEVKELAEENKLATEQLKHPPTKDGVMDTFRYHTEDKHDNVEGLDRTQRLKAVYWWMERSEDKIEQLEGRIS